MSPNMVAWRPSSGLSGGGAPAPVHASAPVWPVFAILAAGLLTLILLWSFYNVVAGAVHRAETGHQLARAEAERLVVCKALATESTRDRCGVAMARHQPEDAILRAAYPQPAWVRHNELTASLD